MVIDGTSSAKTHWEHYIKTEFSDIDLPELFIVGMTKRLESNSITLTNNQFDRGSQYLVKVNAWLGLGIPGTQSILDLFRLEKKFCEWQVVSAIWKKWKAINVHQAASGMVNLLKLWAFLIDDPNRKAPLPGHIRAETTKKDAIARASLATSETKPNETPVILTHSHLYNKFTTTNKLDTDFIAELMKLVDRPMKCQMGFSIFDEKILPYLRRITSTSDLTATTVGNLEIYSGYLKSVFVTPIHVDANWFTTLSNGCYQYIDYELEFMYTMLEFDPSRTTSAASKFVIGLLDYFLVLNSGLTGKPETLVPYMNPWSTRLSFTTHPEQIVDTSELDERLRYFFYNYAYNTGGGIEQSNVSAENLIRCFLYRYYVYLVPILLLYTYKNYIAEFPNLLGFFPEFGDYTVKQISKQFIERLLERLSPNSPELDNRFVTTFLRVYKEPTEVDKKLVTNLWLDTVKEMNDNYLAKLDGFTFEIGDRKATNVDDPDRPHALIRNVILFFTEVGIAFINGTVEEAFSSQATLIPPAQDTLEGSYAPFFQKRKADDKPIIAFSPNFLVKTENTPTFDVEGTNYYLIGKSYSPIYPSTSNWLLGPAAVSDNNQ